LIFRRKVLTQRKQRGIGWIERYERRKQTGGDYGPSVGGLRLRILGSASILFPFAWTKRKTRMGPPSSIIQSRGMILLHEGSKRVITAGFDWRRQVF
jgi:hypothetical protein